MKGLRSWGAWVLLVLLANSMPATALIFSAGPAPTGTPGGPTKASVAGCLTIAEADASPTISCVQSLTLTNGTLTDTGGGNATIGITKSDVGLGNVDNTSDATKNSAVATLTNKLIPPRVVAQAPVSNTLTPSLDTTDVLESYSLAATTTIANPTATLPGVPFDQQRLELVLKSAAPQTLSWGTAYSNECGLALPTGTTGDGTTYNHMLFSYNATSTKWCLLATTQAPQNRVTTLASSTTYSCPASTSDQCEMQMTGSTGTLTVASPGGSPNNGDLLMLSFLCTNAQTFAFNAIFIASPNISIPSTCPADTSKWTKVGVQYSSFLTKWQVIATN